MVHLIRIMTLFIVMMMEHQEVQTAFQEDFLSS